MRQIFTILVIALFFTAGCTEKQEVVKIGVVLPLTGPAALHAQNEKLGMDFAIKELNSDGGINGKMIRLIYEDDQTNPSKTVAAVKKLSEIDKVEIIVGGTWDFLANAAMPEAEFQKVVLISPSALPSSFMEKSSYFFHMHSPIAVNQKQFESYILERKEKKFATIVVNNPWGLAHLETFKLAAENAGANIEKEIALPNPDNNDFKTELAQLKELNVEVIFANINFNDATFLTRKIKEFGMDVEIIAHSNLKTAVNAGKISKEDAKGTTIFRYSGSSEKFEKKFEKEYGKKPEIYSDISYDTIYVIKQAIEKHGYSAEGIIKGLREVNFTGASGNIYFGDKNYPENKQPVLEVI